MSLLFCDSFDHYATADLLTKWTAKTNTPAIDATSGRRGGGCLLIANANADLTKTLSTNYATLIVGFALLGAGSETANFLNLYDAGTLQVAVRRNTDGTFSVLRNTTVLGTSVATLANSTYAYIELKVTINNTGSYELRMNGVNILSNGSVDTQNTANAFANQVRVLGANVDYYFDDLYVCDNAGASNNDFLGDIRIDAIYPNNAGNYQDFTTSAGVDHYPLIDDATPSTADYVFSSTTGHKETNDLGDLAVSNIKGIQVCNYALKTDAGAMSVRNLIRSSTTDANGATVALATSGAYLLSIHELDPATSAAWGISAINALEAGLEVM